MRTWDLHIISFKDPNIGARIITYAIWGGGGGGFLIINIPLQQLSGRRVSLLLFTQHAMNAKGAGQHAQTVALSEVIACKLFFLLLPL